MGIVRCRDIGTNGSLLRSLLAWDLRVRCRSSVVGDDDDSKLYVIIIIVITTMPI